VPGFDPKVYEDGVLKPLRRRMPNLPDDLLTRYAVDPAMDPVALRERVETVVRLWNKHAMRAGPLGLVCKQLVREHKELQSTGDPTSPEFWVQWSAAHDGRVGSQIDEVVALLASSYGALGMLTGSQLRATAAGHGSLSDADLEQARSKAGLTVVEAVELPSTAGMRGRFESLRTALISAGAATVPALLHPDVTSFGLLGGFTVPGSRPEPALDRQAALDRTVELEKLLDSPTVRAQKEATGILVSEAGGGTDLAVVALFHLLTEARARRAEGAPPSVLHNLLTRRGLVRDEAGLVTVSLLVEGAAVGRDPTAVVTELLAEGRPMAAERAAAALPGADGDHARAAVARQRRQVDDLREQAMQDVAAGRDEQAGSRLREALRLGTDVPGLADLLATVPPAAVLAVTANPDGVGVRVAWRPAVQHGDDTTYRVVRCTGRDPADPDDGDEVGIGAVPAATDSGPPVGRDLHYAVFARSPGGRWSRPACATVQVVPPVTEVHIDGEAGAVVGRWKVHPGVATVEVRRSEGTPDAPAVPIAVERNRGFRDTTAVDGVQYYYTVVACYPAAGGGGMLRAEPQVHRGATRVEARPVTSLTATTMSGDTPSVRLSWRQRPGNEVVVRRAGTACPWEYGAGVGTAELNGWGVEVDGPFTLRGEAATLVAAVPSGRSYFVAFTLGSAGAVRGQDAVVDLADPVRRLRAQRFGDEVLVTWYWPDEVTAADVRWVGGTRRISRQRYRDEGGCRLGAFGAGDVRRVDVEAVMFDAGGAEVRAPAVSVEVDERPPELTYEVRRRGHRLAGGVRCTVTVSGSELVTDATLVLVGAAGHAMPLSPGAGVEMLRQPVSVTPGVPVVLPEVPVPPMLRKPYWLRCFLAEPAPALLVDPPVSQLKVS
jgi:hypothetical protein